MSDAVAVTAFREFGHDACGVWYTVAILALGYHLVFLLVAGYAEERFVLGFAGDKQAERFGVTSAALFRRGVSCICHVFRLMRFVALLAVSSGLFGRVRLMALGALGNLAMNVVAEGAGEFAVLARICFQLGNLRCVAGEARVGDIAAKDDLFRLMRVSVALEAAAKFVMRFAFVALATERYDLFDCRRVPLVTILAGYLGFV